MLVASRSFGYDSAHRALGTKTSPERRSETASSPPLERPPRKEGFRGFGWRPDNFKPLPSVESTRPKPVESRPRRISAEALTVASPPSTTSSGASPALARTLPRPITPRKSHDKLPVQIRRRNDSHDASAVTPSVAALLAMTSIPRKKKFATEGRSHVAPRRMSLAELREEWASLDSSSSFGMSNSPTMGVLLSPPREEDNPMDFDESPADDDSSTWAPSRSTSSESMPSLDHDDASFSSWSLSTTPQRSPGRQRSVVGKPERFLSSPQSIDSVLDHPLVALEDECDYSDGESNDWRSIETYRSRTSSPSPPASFRSSITPVGSAQPTSSFRSNLTASLQALRRAATSFSNFAAPSIMPDDHISRGILGPAGLSAFRSEMRPRQLSGTPTPQLRRYLNPMQHGTPPRQVAHDFHLHDSHIDHTDLEAAAYPVDGISVSSSAELLQTLPGGAVIPLQDYIVSSEVQPATRANGTSTFTTEAGRAAEAVGMQQRREPRENSEFLRICVLELSMRRHGKMEGPLGIGPGRKAWWLPPRESTAGTALDEECGKGVPRRWRGISVQDDDEHGAEEG